MTQLLESQEVYNSEFEGFTDGFRFKGKTLSEWDEELYVSIPKTIQPDSFRQTYFDLIKKIQLASHYYNATSSVCKSISADNEAKKADLIVEIINEYKKKDARKPAASLMDQMAAKQMPEDLKMELAAQIVKEYWKTQRETLSEVRRCMEQIGISMHSEMKLGSSY
jgi:hypothetical protein